MTENLRKFKNAYEAISESQIEFNDQQTEFLKKQTEFGLASASPIQKMVKPPYYRDNKLMKSKKLDIEKILQV